VTAIAKRFAYQVASQIVSTNALKRAKKDAKNNAQLGVSTNAQMGVKNLA